ncbi:hypothetical protein [Altericista sp. CCNU0014]|uniref:hypothetical protein n=1 Tax=Altericista sp. CCNU0014 TaxID=3082949 RepID=UPI00384BD964
MFVQELSPIFQEFVQKPVAFLGGFASGILRLNPSEDPLRTWLDRGLGVTVSPSSTTSEGNNSNGSGPQSIDID